MRKKMIIILTSTMLSILIMSGGYSLWTDKLTITGRIIIEEATPNNTTVQSQELDNKKLELDTKSNQESLNQNIEEPTDPEIQIDKGLEVKEDKNLTKENTLDEEKEVGKIEGEVPDDQEESSVNTDSEKK